MSETTEGVMSNTGRMTNGDSHTPPVSEGERIEITQYP